jgi:hypothetical protein
MMNEKATKKLPIGRGGARPNAGRKKIIIDPEEVERFCSRGATVTDLAAAFGCSLRTIELRRKRRDFAAAELRGRSKFRTFIRSHAMKLVAEGNASVTLQMEKRYCQASEPAPSEIAASNRGREEKLLERIDGLLDVARAHEQT